MCYNYNLQNQTSTLVLFLLFSVTKDHQIYGFAYMNWIFIKQFYPVQLVNSEIKTTRFNEWFSFRANLRILCTSNYSFSYNTFFTSDQNFHCFDYARKVGLFPLVRTAYVHSNVTME